MLSLWGFVSAGIFKLERVDDSSREDEGHDREADDVGDVIAKGAADQFEGDENEEDHHRLVESPEKVLRGDKQEIQAPQACRSPEAGGDHQVRISHDGNNDWHGIEGEDHVADLNANQTQKQWSNSMCEKLTGVDGRINLCNFAHEHD